MNKFTVLLLFLMLFVGCATPKTTRPKPCLLTLEPTPHFDQKGIFKVREETKDKIKYYLPENLPNGCAIPLAFNNGTFLSCKSYDPYNRFMASHGFVVACPLSRFTGSGKDCVKAIDKLMEHPLTNKSIIGIAGHSQGGGGTHACHELAEREHPNRLITSFGLQPAHGLLNLDYRKDYAKIKGPVGMVSGTDDWIVPNSWVERGYNAVRSPKRWYEIQGISHESWFDSPARTMGASSLSWFRWQLLGDGVSRDHFNYLPSTPLFKDIGNPVDRLYRLFLFPKTTEEEDLANYKKELGAKKL